MLVKICGVTTVDDALFAASNGADFIGMIFVSNSARKVQINVARDIVNALREAHGQVKDSRLETNLERLVESSRPLTVGVFQSQDVNEINDIIASVGLDVCQIHGPMPVDISSISVPTIRTIEVEETDTPETVLQRIHASTGDVILLDAKTSHGSGGLGVSFDWTIAAKVALKMPLVLAGGLNPDNIQLAIASVAPWCVDVSSGVESESRGIKDKHKAKPAVIDAPPPRSDQLNDSDGEDLAEKLKNASLSAPPAKPKVLSKAKQAAQTSAKTPPSTSNSKKAAHEQGRRTRSDPFDAYLKKSVVDAAPEKYLQGLFRVNPRNRKIAYVTVEGFTEDFCVIGWKDQNRALHGDKVAFEVIGSVERGLFEDIQSGSQYFAADGDVSAKPLDLSPGGAAEIVDDDDDMMKVYSIGKVVAVFEEKPRENYAGFFMPLDWSLGNKQKPAHSKTPRNVYFQPVDRKCPLFLVSASECPIYDDFEKYAKSICVVNFHRWPASTRFPYARFVKCLGFAGDIHVETEVIVENNNIRDIDFQPGVLKCLPSLPWSIPQQEIDNRRDFRDECVFTIDPETARDLDDAVSCKVLDDDTYEIGVHIADVSFFVRPGTALDYEAFERATSTYFVQKVVPMLPGTLCENLCSLNPGVERLAYSVVWRMSKDAEILGTWFGRTVIKSCIKFSYEEAQKLIDGNSWESVISRDSMIGSHAPFLIVDNLNVFFKLSKIMRKKRFDNGALRIDQPKLSFRLDETNHPSSCQVYQIRDSNKLVEEFMLLANISVAEKISSTFPDISLLRCHPPPLQRTLKTFLGYCTKMGYDVDASTSGSFQNSITAIQDPQVAKLFQILAIKPMQRAKYFCSGEYENVLNWRHFALSVPTYTHFTSPIRRYADVVVHRILTQCLDSSGVASQPYVKDQVIKIARQCNNKKDNARAAQDASSKLFLCMYLQKLETQIGREIVVSASVLDVGLKSIDVYIAEYAIDRRVFYADLGLVSVTVNSSKNAIELVWPKNMATLPPIMDEAARKVAPKLEKDGSQCTTFKKPSDTSDVRQTIRILGSVKVRLFVSGESPLELQAYLMHPEYQVLE